MPSAKIFNREVYILVDQSATMRKKDPYIGDKSRWDYLQELLEGDIGNILEETSHKGEKICDFVSLCFFSRDRVNALIEIHDIERIEDIFMEYRPDANTFITRSLEMCVEDWKRQRSNSNKGAFIIIYTDGQLDDKKNFEKSIEKICQDIDSQDDIKIVMIGIAKELYEKPQYYLNIDFNVNQNKTKNGDLCNIFVFELAQKMTDNIIEVLDRQLRNDPSQDPSVNLPEWVKKEFPEWVKERSDVLSPQRRK